MRWIRRVLIAALLLALALIGFLYTIPDPPARRADGTRPGRTGSPRDPPARTAARRPLALDAGKRRPPR